MAEEVDALHAALGAPDAPAAGATASLCKFLRPLAQAGQRGLRAGFFAGFGIRRTTGPLSRVYAREQIWDLYNQQMAAAVTTRSDVATPEMSGWATAYAGFAFGFASGVRDWYGSYGSAYLDGGLPLLRDFAGLGARGFVAGRDADGDGRVTADERLAGGLHGFAVDVRAGVDLLGAALPDFPVPYVGAGTGTAVPFVRGTLQAYQKLRRLPIPGRGRLVVRLVAEREGACEVSSDGDAAGAACHVAFGAPDWSHLQRAAHLAFALCRNTDMCLTPPTATAALAALAIGVYRDAGGSFEELCSGTV